MDVSNNGTVLEDVPEEVLPPTDTPAETHGARALKEYHKGLCKLRKSLGRSLDPLDEGPVKAHLAEHHAGMEKALKACAKFHGKAFKGSEALPDDYEDEDDPIMTKAEDMPEEQPVEDDMGEPSPLLGDHAGTSMEGERPADEAAYDEANGEPDGDEDDIDEEELERIEKSLYAAELALGLRR